MPTIPVNSTTDLRESLMELNNGTSQSLKYTKAEVEAVEPRCLAQNDADNRCWVSESQAQGADSRQISEDRHCVAETEKLRADIVRLQQRVAELSVSKTWEKQDDTPWPVLHRVHCPKASKPATYIDKPIWVRDDSHNHLDGRRRISEEEKWKTCQEGMPFVVFFEYFCKNDEQDPVSKTSRRRRNAFDNEGQQAQVLSIAQPLSEEVHILSYDLSEAIKHTFNRNSDLAFYFPMDFSDKCRFNSPYLFHYHFPHEIHKISKELSSVAQSLTESFQLFQDYLKAQTESREREADYLFGQGIVTPEYLPYLFRPGELLIKHNDDGDVVVRQNGTFRVNTLEKPDPFGLSSAEASNKTRVYRKWQASSIPVMKVQFDGQFRAVKEMAPLNCSDGDESHLKIQHLPLYPLRYADQGVKRYLRERGEFFYSCRNGRYVIGPGHNNDGLVGL